MATYVSRRVLQAILVIYIVATVIFATSHLAANPVNIMLPPGATDQDRQNLSELLGLNKSLVAQYGIYLTHLYHGNFGTSSLFHVPVLPLVMERAGPTIQLALAAMLWAILFGVGIGIFVSLVPGSKFDRFVGGCVAIAQGTASFWLAVMLLFLFSVTFGWFPVAGNDSGLRAYVLPAITLGLSPFVSILRLTRSAMIETLSQNFIRNAKARGLSSRKVIINHAFRNSLSSVLTYSGILLGALVSGAVITETIFSWPGIGQLSILAINNGDYALVQAVTLVSSSAIIFLNLLIDLVNLYMNPVALEKVRLSGKI
ncbi:MAG: ABC transporter permease [Actinobacteria bacterium]|nr:MAG: ABC transporter permease [Actinomycetota bacterium]